MSRLHHADTVVDGLGTWLAEQGIARYSPTGAYTGAETLPAVTGLRLPIKPVHAVALAVYMDDRQRDRHNPDVYVQVRLRTAGLDPRPCDRWLDELFDRLDGASHVRLGAVPLLTAERVSRGITEANASGGNERADNYRLTLNATGSP